MDNVGENDKKMETTDPCTVSEKRGTKSSVSTYAFMPDRKDRTEAK